VIAPIHDYVFDQQAGHTLAIAVLGVRIFPEPWKILREREDGRSLFIIKYPAVLFTALFVLPLSFTQCPQLLVPVWSKYSIALKTWTCFRFLRLPLTGRKKLGFRLV